MKLHTFTGLFLIAASLAVTGCFRKDVRSIEVSVPQMKSEACYKYIQEVLNRTEGIRTNVPDLNRRVVVVEYDALRLAIKNIEFVIAGAGFDANDTLAPENVKANLPAECR